MIVRIVMMAFGVAFAGCLVTGSQNEDADQGRLLAQRTMAGRDFKTTEISDGFFVQYVKEGDGSLIVAIFNRNSDDESVTIRFSDLGSGGAFSAHDISRNEDDGVVWGEYVANIPKGSANVFCFKRIRCPRCE